jgi:dimethylargininase
MTGVAVVRRPGPLLADGLVEHIERVPVDLDLALAQWHGYVGALHEAGWRTVEAPPADDCPDAVFVEDTAVVIGSQAVVTRPARASRRGETAGVATLLADLGVDLLPIGEDACLEGGDVLKIGDTVYVGRGGRTDAAGIAALRALMRTLGRRVVAVPVSTVLHLKSAVTALPDGTVIGFAPFVDAPTLFERFLPVPEPDGSAVVDLGGDRLLMSASAPRTASLLTDLGYDVRTVDIGEFEKLEGCVTCLSIRVRHLR